jgi:YD repeat-containing protein
MIWLTSDQQPHRFQMMFFKFILAALVAALIALSLPAHAGSTVQRDAPTTRFYDSRGNATGSASTYGNTTRFYDARGNSIGTATRNGRR